jgi:hypothetical protein
LPAQLHATHVPPAHVSPVTHRLFAQQGWPAAPHAGASFDGPSTTCASIPVSGGEA